MIGSPTAESAAAPLAEAEPEPQAEPYVPPQRTQVAPAPGAKPSTEVHLTRVHEVSGGGLFERNYTLYTLQYNFNLLPTVSSDGHTNECDRRYSDFEDFHGETYATTRGHTHTHTHTPGQRDVVGGVFKSCSAPL